VGSFIDNWQRIAALDAQPVLRNLLITQGYHELSRGFARMLGPEDITWFGFASWSSKTVGRFLQNEQLPRLLAEWLERAQPTAAGAPPLSAAVHDMRAYLIKGNTEVFRELAPLFGRFLTTFETDREPDLARLERFLASLAQGESAPDHVAAHPATCEIELLRRGGQSLLRDALRHYYHAKFESDAKRKAERILLANLHIGMHEQTRLQTYIRGALEAPVRRLLAAPPASARSSDYATWLSIQARNLFRRFATERVLTLSLPDSQLRLGQDLRAAPGQPLIPTLLQDIEHPELGRVFSHYAASSDSSRPARTLSLLARATDTCNCRRLFALDVPFTGNDAPRATRAAASRARIENCGTVARGTGAHDWASLHERMRFIIELFRSRQRNQRLLEPTFSPAQVDVLERGGIPDGPLT
jgi:hypothetical protein